MRPVVFGVAGSVLTAEDARFFRDADPLGFILFKRNCLDKDQVRALTAALREAVGRTDAPIMIDQEGGRVARLRPPHWPTYPTAKVFGDLAKHDLAAAETAARLNYALIGWDLTEIGITMDCAPLVDVPVDGAHEMIGDRAFGSDPRVVARLGRAACEGFLSASVLPIVKHLPGYGRAGVDSHQALPVIEESIEVMESTDLYPFRHLADFPWGMTAHALYPAIDPEQPATISPTIIREIIRGRIGFSGILITDDLSMEALDGTIAQRTAAALAAGCDIALHCNGDLTDMRAIAEVVPAMSPELGAKVDAAEQRRRTGAIRCPADAAEARRHLDGILAQASHHNV